VRITVGTNGQFYSLGRRGAMKTKDGLEALIKADIAAGKFGEMAPQVASQLVDFVKKAYDALQE